MGEARLPLVHVALGVEIHVATGGCRRRLSIVDRDRLTALGDVHEHEAAAAEIAGAGQGDRESEPDGDRRVHRVAALAQDLHADAGRARFLARDHPVLRVHRMEDVARGEDGLVGA